MDDQHRQEFGQMPGMSEAPLNPSFRDGPASKPMRVPWWKPALVIVAAAGAFIVLVNLV
ncbi:hypothetical protein ACFOE1_04980 [Agromyces mediolanus]|uniref:hypothetical protein n=1 Tax=Agromyces mediolanus TaxID=41986 RepID=UPI0016656CED|nr:hypothetical protein [Agromyces mediolanus]